METGSRIDKEEATGKPLIWSPQPILGGSEVHVVQAQRNAMEKGAPQREKGENQEKGQKILKKEKHFLTPRLYPNKRMLGPARVVLVDQSDES